MPVHASLGALSIASDAEPVARHADGHRFTLQLLDGFHLKLDGRGIRLPLSAQRLVAYLGLRGTSSRAEAAGTLWPEILESKAHASLRTVIWRLHQSTSVPVLATRDTLALQDTVTVDVRVFGEAARRVLQEQRGTTASELRVGELLPGWYDDWVMFERERLRQLQMHALEALASRLTTERRYAEAIEAALDAVALEPLRESANRALIVAHLAENNVIEAVRRFDMFRECLAGELGVEPTPGLERLVLSALRPLWSDEVAATARR